ncbi:MAG: ImmA/IrrE family metallo-endopeptidase [Chloroflexi bacterium]|nr:ImmA/IrrE family metallo-endopeptidase [Chloroflexota bacterium]
MENLAYKVYKRPLAVFFSPHPPQEPDLKQEFRTLPGFEIDQLAADTRYQLRIAKALQISLKELNDGINPSQRKIFVDIVLSERSAVQPAARAIREYLGVTLAAQSAWKTDDEALKTWRNAIEETGIFVFKHAFRQKAISSFCLFDEEFPLIYLNNSTAKTRQVFSLFHELTHLLLRVNAISKFDKSYIAHLPEYEKRLEQFCNVLSAELLIPSDDFATQISTVKTVDDEVVQRLAGRYRISREAILRRFLDRDMVSQTFYEAKAKQWIEESTETGKGGNYFATQATYLGEHYLRLVFEKHYQGKLTVEEVADYLGVRSKNVPGLEALMLRKAVAA